MTTKFEEITGKVSRGEDLTDAEKKVMGDYKEQDVEALVNARSADNRRKLEARLEEKDKSLSEKDKLLIQKEEEIENLKTSDLSELDKMKKDYEKLTEAHKAKIEELGQAKKSNEQLQRGHKIDAIVAKMKFIDGYSPEDARIILAHKLSDVDLGDESEVSTKVTEFQTANKGVLVANTGGGAGSHSDGDRNVNAGNTDTQSFTREQIRSMTPEEQEKNEKAIWQAEKEGKIT